MLVRGSGGSTLENDRDDIQEDIKVEGNIQDDFGEETEEKIENDLTQPL